jgi:predicted HTH transcriptional regulator
MVDYSKKNNLENPKLEIKDTYKTIEFVSEEILFKEKNSKFLATPFNQSETSKTILSFKTTPNAGHFVMPIK